MIKEALIGSCEDEILADCRTALEKHRFSEDEIDLYLSHVVEILNCYRECFGDDTKLEYHVRKRFNRIELRLVVQGEKVNPLEWVRERGDTGQSVEQALSPLVWNQTDVISHVYLAGRNIVTIASPHIKAKALHRSPMLHAVVLGLALGAALLMLEDKVDGLKDILPRRAGWRSISSSRLRSLCCCTPCRLRSSRFPQLPGKAS